MTRQILRYGALIFLGLLCCSHADRFRLKTYTRAYYQNGNLKAEGWELDGTRNGYWKFYYIDGVLAEKGHFRGGAKDKYWHYYYPNGQVEKEGHYMNGDTVRWWIFYDNKGRIYHKCQLKEGKKNGYCLKYTNEKLTSAEKYHNGKKVGEWLSLHSFKKENKLSDLK